MAADVVMIFIILNDNFKPLILYTLLYEYQFINTKSF